MKIQWKDIKELANKLADNLKGKPVLSFALLLILILAFTGGMLRPEYLWLVVLVVIAVLIYSFVELILPVVDQWVKQLLQARIPQPEPLPKPQPDETSKPQDQGETALPAQISPKLSEAQAREQYLESLIRELRPMRNVAFERTSGDLDSPEALMLDTIYIDLMTQTPRKEEQENIGQEVPKRSAPPDEKRNLTVLEALQQAPDRHMVLLGRPGTGKSTFVRYLALGMAKAIQGEPIKGWQWTGQPLLPVVVRLGDISPTLSENLPAGSALIERFIVLTLENDRDGKAPLAAYILDILKRDGGIVFFDGLDEITNLAQREAIKNAIESFTAHFGRHPQSIFLVTCRTYSYTDSRWKLTGWQQHELALLNDEQISQFITDWYQQHALIRPNAKALYEAKRKELAEALDPDRSKRKQLIEISRYPIVLTVVAIVHATRELPEHTVEVYKECVELLLERWRIFRRIGGQVQVYNLWEELGEVQKTIYAALYEIAFEAHRGYSGNLGDAEDTQITDSLLWNVLGKHLKHENTSKFFEYCNRSNGLLMLRGVNPGKPKDSYLYTFPHRSFQEYLASQYLLDRVREGDCEQVRDLLSARFDTWREVVRFLGEYCCYDKDGSVRDIRDVLDQLAPKKLPEGMQDNGWRMIWLAGDLLKSYREVYRNKPYEGDHHVFSSLIRLVQSGALDLTERAAAADTLDALGHLPADLDTFIFIPGDGLSRPGENAAEAAITNEFWIARYPITNAQYERFLKAPDYAADRYWMDLPAFGSPDEEYKPLPLVDGREYRREQPRYWDDPVFGIARKGVPVVGVSWYEASAFCKWLQENWNAHACAGWKAANRDIDLGSLQIRLPTEAEWVAAALTPAPLPVGEGNQRRPEEDDLPYPWSRPGRPLDKPEDVQQRANVGEGGIGRTTPVDMYPQGQSPLGVWDMSGNVWEWQVNYYDQDHDFLGLRGGSWASHQDLARVSCRNGDHPDFAWSGRGFRVVVAPSRF